MALLAFNVEADYTEALRLRKEIESLEKALDNADYGTKNFDKLNGNLADARRKLAELVSDAAKDGARMQEAFAIRDKELTQKISNVRSALDGERATIGRLIKDIEKLEAASLEAFRTGDVQKLADARKKLADAHSELQDAQTKEGEYAFDLSELNTERAINLKENGIYKYIMEGATEGAADAADRIDDGLGEAFARLQEGGNEVKNILNDIVSVATGVSVGNLFTMGLEGAYSKLKGVYDQSLKVREEMQDIQSTMDVFLGDKSKSQKFVGELEDAAYYNMFEFSDLVEGSKQMLAYGQAVETIIPRLNQLSEVATATHKPLGQLVDMYNRAKSIGYVNGQMQQSWASQGIVLKDIMNEMGIASSSTKITFEQLNQVLDHLTQEGGQFHGIMAAQLNNISAEEGQLADNLHSMYNEMGQMFEGAKIKSLKMRSAMVEHWKDIAKWMGFAVATFGTYRTALLLMRATNTAAQGGQTGLRLATIALSLATDADTKAKVINKVATDAQTKAMLINKVARDADAKASLIAAVATKDASQAQLIEAVAASNSEKRHIRSAIAKKAHTTSNLTLAGSFKMLTASMIENTKAALSNPYVLMAAAIAALVGIIYYGVTAETEQERATRKVADENQRYLEGLKKRREEEESLADIISNENSTELERYEAYKKLSEILPELTEKYTAYQLAQMTPEQLDKVKKDAQRVRRRKDEDDRKQQVEEAGRYTDYENIGGKLLSQEQAYEYRTIITSAKMSDEMKKRREELEQIGTENAQGLADLYQDLNPEEGKQSMSEMLKFMEDFHKNNEASIKGMEKMREEEEYAKKPLSERVKLERDAADAAKERFEIYKAAKDVQDRYTMSTDDLLTQAQEKGIEVSEWVNFDENTLRKKLLEALNEADIEKIKTSPVQLPIELDITALKDQESILGRLAKWVGLAAEKAQNTVDNARKQAEDAEKQATKSETELNNTRTTEELRKEAKKRENLIKTIQKKFAQGNFVFNDAEKELLKSNEKLKKILEMIEGQNGQLSQVQAQEFNNLLGQEMQEAQGAYKDAGGDIADKLEQEAENRRRVLKDNRLKIEKEQREADNAETQSRIDSMRDGSEKIIAQRDFDHKKELQRIEQQKKDRKKAAEEAAKAEWKAANPEAKDSAFENSKKAILEKSETYQKLAAAAEKAYQSEIKSSNLKYDSSAELLKKYAKEEADRRKNLAENESDRRKAVEKANKILKERGQEEIKELTAEQLGRIITITPEIDGDALEELKDLQRILTGIDGRRIQIEFEADKAFHDYISKYGSLEQRLTEITESYRVKIESTQDEWLKRLYERQREEAIANAYKGESENKYLEYYKRREAIDREYATKKRDIELDIAKNEKVIASQTSSEIEKNTALELNRRLRGELLTLGGQETKAIASLAIEQIKSDPTFFQAFNDIEAASTESLKTLRENIEAAKESMADLDPKDIKVFAQEMGRIENELIKRNPLKSLIRNFKDYKAAQDELVRSQESVRSAENNRNSLFESEDNGVFTYSEEQIEEYRRRIEDARRAEADAQENLSNQEVIDNAELYAEAQNRLAEATQNVYTAEEDLMRAQRGQATTVVLKATQDLTNARNRQAQAEDNVANTGNRVKKSLNQTGQNLEKLGGAVNKVGGDLEQFGGETAKYIKGIGTMVSSVGGAMMTASQLASDSISTIEKASAILAIISAAIQLATAAADLLGFTKDDSDYEDAKAEYQELISIWDTLIDKKKEYLSESWGNEAVKASKEAMNLVKEQQKAAAELARERLGAGASMGSHSYGVRMNKELSEYYRSIGIGDISDLTKMTGKQLEEVRDNYSLFWSKLDDDFREFLEDIINGDEAIKDLEDQIKERLTGITFDSMFDNFTSNLMDMNSTAEDFIDDVSKYMMQSIVNNQIGTMLQKNLEDWYNNYYTLLSNQNGTLSESQIAKLKAQYKEYANEALEARNLIAEMTGYDQDTSSSSGSSKVASNVSQDSIDEANGRMTAIQLGQQDIKSAINSFGASLVNLSQSQITTLQAIAAERTNYILGIARQISETYLEVQGIHEDTSEMRTAIRQMRAFMNDWDNYIRSI